MFFRKNPNKTIQAGAVARALGPAQPGVERAACECVLATLPRATDSDDVAERSAAREAAGSLLSGAVATAGASAGDAQRSLAAAEQAETQHACSAVAFVAQRVAAAARPEEEDALSVGDPRERRRPTAF